MLPILHYVDDYFCAECEQCIQIAKECFARLVRACLGESSISDRKLEHGNPLTVLGIDMRLDVHGVAFWPSADKVQKWIQLMQLALDRGTLTGGEASKLAGKLQWACSTAFRGIGRAMIRFRIHLANHAFPPPHHVFVRPIINQIKVRSPSIKPRLRAALVWWVEVLQLRLV